jgi:uncharacterized RDD family membrane protein YckC
MAAQSEHRSSADQSPPAAPAGGVERPVPIDYSVLTPERVSLDYDIAGLGSRGAAALVDTALQIGLLILLWLALAIVGGLVTAGLGGGAGDDSGAALALGLGLVILFLLTAFLVLWGYYLVFEIVWNGQTPGKRLMGVRVIRENGYPLRASDSVIRNLVRIVDAPPFGFALGALIMLLNERGRRAGDYAAGTIVIREARLRSLADLTAPAQGTAAWSRTRAASSAPMAGEGPEVRLDAAEATLVRDFLLRRASLEPRARTVLAHRLADLLVRRYGLFMERPSNDEALLERLAG